jgi:hypothetical protein
MLFPRQANILVGDLHVEILFISMRYVLLPQLQTPLC